MALFERVRIYGLGRVGVALLETVCQCWGGWWVWDFKAQVRLVVHSPSCCLAIQM